MQKKKGNKLTAKQRRFCEEYVTDLNATQAAIRAGYSPKRASEQAYQLLQKTTVQALIQQLQEKLSEKTQISAEKVIHEFAKIAFSNPKKLYDASGNIIPINELPEEVAATITEIKTKHFKSKLKKAQLIETTYKLHSKTSALESLGKHLGIFEKDNKQKGESSAALFLELMKTATAEDGKE